MNLDQYDPQESEFFDEVFALKGEARKSFQPLVAGLKALGSSAVLARQAAAENALLQAGITFTFGHRFMQINFEEIW